MTRQDIENMTADFIGKLITAFDAEAMIEGNPDVPTEQDAVLTDAAEMITSVLCARMSEHRPTPLQLAKEAYEAFTDATVNLDALTVEDAYDTYNYSSADDLLIDMLYTVREYARENMAR